MTHPDLSVKKEIAQINMRCIFFTWFFENMSASKTGLQMGTQDIMY